MEASTVHLMHADIRQRLEKLKASIKRKREEAKELFQTVLEKFRVRELGIVIHEDIKKQLEHIKNILLLTAFENTAQKQVEFKEKVYEKLVLSDVLQAIQLLSTPPGQKSKILVSYLEEELKKRLSLQFAERNVQLTADWKAHVKDSDIAAVLGSDACIGVTAPFGGPIAMLERSLQLAQGFSNVLSKVASKEQVNTERESLSFAVKPMGSSR